LGQRVAGHIDVLDDVVRVELQLPGVLGWIGERIGRRIQKQAARARPRSSRSARCNRNSRQAAVPWISPG
jgi:hypothetical protein